MIEAASNAPETLRMTGELILNKYLSAALNADITIKKTAERKEYLNFLSYAVSFEKAYAIISPPTISEKKYGTADKVVPPLPTLEDDIVKAKASAYPINNNPKPI